MLGLRSRGSDIDAEANLLRHWLQQRITSTRGKHRVGLPGVIPKTEIKIKFYCLRYSQWRISAGQTNLCTFRDSFKIWLQHLGSVITGRYWVWQIATEDIVVQYNIIQSLISSVSWRAITNYVRSEVLTAVNLKNTVFWHAALCRRLRKFRKNALPLSSGLASFLRNVGKLLSIYTESRPRSCYGLISLACSHSEFWNYESFRHATWLPELVFGSSYSLYLHRTKQQRKRGHIHAPAGCESAITALDYAMAIIIAPWDGYYYR
jgi:hypothetical protein